MGLSHSQGQSLAKGGSERDSVQKSAVNTGNRDHAAFSADLQDLSQYQGPVESKPQRLLGLVHVSVNGVALRLHTHSVDTGVRSAASGHGFEGLDQVRDFFIVE